MDIFYYKARYFLSILTWKLSQTRRKKIDLEVSDDRKKFFKFLESLRTYF